MAGENDYSTIWANGQNIQTLWGHIKTKFVSGYFDQTAYEATWRAQARANIGLTIGDQKIWYGNGANTIGELPVSTLGKWLLNSTIAANKIWYASAANTLTATDISALGRSVLNATNGVKVGNLFAEFAEKDESGNNIKATYANKLAIYTDNNVSYLGLYNKNNSVLANSSVILNSQDGLVQLKSGKIPLALFPDAIAGQMLFAGTVDSYTSADKVYVTLTNNAANKLHEKIPAITTTNKNVYLTTASTSGTYNNKPMVSYVDCEGMYFLWTSGAIASGQTSREWSGERFQVGDWLVSVGGITAQSGEDGWRKIDNTDAVTSVEGINDANVDTSIYGTPTITGAVVMNAGRVRALDTGLPNNVQNVKGKVEFEKDIWSLAGVGAYGISDLSMGGGGGGGLSGSILRDWANFDPNDETQILGSNLGIESFRMNGKKMQFKRNNAWVDAFTLSGENIPNIGLDQVDDAEELQAIETLASTGTPSGFLKRASNGTWSFDTTAYLPLSGGTLTNTDTNLLTLNSTDANNTGSYIQFSTNGTQKAEVGYWGGKAYLQNESGSTAHTLEIGSDGKITFDSNKIWHAGNDGSGSGLDADLLDGKHASELFTTLENDNEQLSATIGTTNKKLTVDYATKALRMKQEPKTDQEFTYRVCPKTIDVDSVKLDRIKGKTLVWNQLVQNGNFTSNSNWSVASGTLTIAGNAATVTVNETSSVKAQIYQAVSGIVGHKYYQAFSAKASTNGTLVNRVNSDYISFNVGTSYVRNSRIFVLSSGTSIECNAQNSNLANGDTFTIKDFVFVDLTLLYGQSVIDSLTNLQLLEKFESDYLPKYYSNNPGQLINNSTKAIESVGFNLWDEEWEKGTFIGGALQPNNTRIRNKRPIRISPNTTYYYKGPQDCYIMDIDSYSGWSQYNSRLVSANSEFTTSSWARYIYISPADAYGAVYNNDICINISKTIGSPKNGDYVPYKRVVTELDLHNIHIKSPNIWDEEWANGVWDETQGGVFSVNQYGLASKDYIPVIANTTYYLRVGGSYAFYVLYYDSSKTLLGYKYPAANAEFTTPANCKYITFYSYNSYGTTYNNDITINKSDTAFNGRYFPHGVLTFNGLKSAGSVYDEITNNGRTLIRRVGDVDLGSKVWYKSGSSTIYFESGGISDITLSSDANATPLVCSKYTPSSQNTFASKDKVIVKQCYGSKNSFVILDSSANSLTDVQFRTSMNGVIAYYELEKYETYELAEPIPMSLPSGTTERRLPEDTQDSVIAPFVADMTYGTNNGDILASATPWERISGRPTIDKGHGADGSWFTVNIGGQTLYIRFNTKGASATNGPGFELEISDSPDPNEQTEDYTKSFAFGTLSTEDINSICV